MTLQITSSVNQQCFKQISKDTFTKYKKVRKMYTTLMGEHYLYSKDGVKYLVKEQLSDVQFFTTRPCSSLFVHKYTPPKSTVTSYIYPLIGIALKEVIACATAKQGLGIQTEAAKEYANLLSRHCNSLEKVLLHILKFLLQLTLLSRHEEHLISEITHNNNLNSTSLHSSITKNSSNLKQNKLQAPPLNIPILLECIFVHNGQLFYCYDTWMNSQAQIVVEDIRQIQNLFLSNSQLKLIQNLYEKQLKRKTQQDQNSLNQIKRQVLNAHRSFEKSANDKSYPQTLQSLPPLFASLYKSFLLTLYLGSSQFNLRLYEWGEFKLSYQNLQKRIHHFKLRHNTSKDKLGSFLEKVLLSEQQGHQEVKLSQILSILSNSSIRQNDLSSSGCKSDFHSSSMKAPKRVTLAKKSKIQSFQNIQLCQSVIKAEKSFTDSALQYGSLNSQIPQTREFKQNCNSCFGKDNSTSKYSATKNRTLSNMVLKECNSMPKFERNQILIAEEKDPSYCSSQKPNVVSSFQKKQPFTSSKKNKENQKNKYVAFSNSSNKHKGTQLSSVKSVKKALFTSKLINQLISAFENISQIEVTSSCGLLKVLGLEYLQSKSQLEEIVLNKMLNMNVNPQWITKQYKDNSFYFGQVQSIQKPDLANPLRHGYGVYIFPSKDIYFGTWSKNLMQGHGTYMFQTGQVYSGQLNQGHKQGFGTFFYSDGRKYEGFWKNDQKIGLGTVYFYDNADQNSLTDNRSKVKFLGEFKQNNNDNETEGIFTGYNNSQTIWSKEGLLEQFDPVSLQFKTKRNKFPQFSNSTKSQNLMNCSISKYREFIDSMGTKYTGQMENNKKQGYGIQESDRFCFQGNFIDNQKNGRGKIVTKQNLIIEGMWSDGMFVEYIID